MIVFAFSFPQLERMVSGSSRAIFLYLAAGYDLAHFLQLRDHHFEVQIWCLLSKSCGCLLKAIMFIGHVSLQSH